MIRDEEVRYSTQASSNHKLNKINSALISETEDETHVDESSKQFSDDKIEYKLIKD